MQYSSEKSNEAMTIKIYCGENGSFELYEDEGDNYNYEKGNYSIIPFTWNEKNKTLKIGSRQGTFEGMTEKRTFNISVIGLSGKTINRTILYDGSAVVSKF
jgi:alpha-D-xyloside xylohydrolase